MSADRSSEALGARRAVFTVLESYNGPSSYAAGGSTVKSLVLNFIDRAQVVGPTTSGLMATVVTGSVTGNTFKVQFFVASGAGGGGQGELAAGQNVSSHGFYVLEEGR